MKEKNIVKKEKRVKKYENSCIFEEKEYKENKFTKTVKKEKKVKIVK